MSLPRGSVLECGGKRSATPLSLSVRQTKVLATLLILATSATFAHDRHTNVAIHQNVVVHISRNQVDVTFQLETNEEGTMIEAIAIDTDADGKLSPAEQSTYFSQLDARLRENLQVSINDQDVSLAPDGQVELSPPSRKTFHFRGAITPEVLNPTVLEVHNDNFLDWPGRTSIEIEPAKGGIFQSYFNLGAGAAGEIAFTDGGSIGLAHSHGFPDWSRWSWPNRLLSPSVLFPSAAIFLIAACLLFLVGRHSPSRRVVASALLIGCVALALYAVLPHEGVPVLNVTWVREFRDFHKRLCTSLTEYHQSGDATPLSALASPEVIRHLTSATRLGTTTDDKSGTFELRRVRPITTTILETPRLSLFPTLRVQHEWRAIGLMRHQGHPHERTRTFTCDYTFRVSDKGLQLIDCSSWHQLPDEPIE